MTDFPYQKEVSGLFGEILRPIAEFEIQTKAGWVPVMGYIDCEDVFDAFKICFEQKEGVVHFWNRYDKH